MKNLTSIDLTFNLKAIKEIENTIKGLKSLYHQGVITQPVYHKCKYQLGCTSGNLYEARNNLKVEKHRKLLELRLAKVTQRELKEKEMMIQIRNKLTQEEQELLKLY